MPNNQKYELVEPERQSIVKRRRRAGIAAAGVLARAAQAGLRGSGGPLKAYRRPPTPRPEQTQRVQRVFVVPSVRHVLHCSDRHLF